VPDLVSYIQSTIGISDSQLESDKYLKSLGRAFGGDAPECIEPKDSDAEPADACGQGGLDTRLGRSLINSPRGNYGEMTGKLRGNDGKITWQCTAMHGRFGPDTTPLFLQRSCNVPVTFLQRSFEHDKKARQSSTCPAKARHAADGRLLLSKGGA